MTGLWKNKRVLVTGGAGLIGSHLVDALVDRRADVVILDNLTPQTHPYGKPHWINPKATFIHGDMRNLEDLSAALEGVEYIFHQAAFGGFTPELSEYIDSNATGTALMFEVIQRKRLPVRKVVVASSQAVYGEGTYYSPEFGIQYPKTLRSLDQLKSGEWELLDKAGNPMKSLPTQEERPLYTETIYGISKLAEEKLAIGLGRKLGIPTVALRYAVTYGPRQSLFNPYTGVVSIFSTQLLNDQSPVVYEDGEQTRDYLYVTDNVAANILVMEKEAANYRIFNVGRGEPVTVNRLVRTLSKLYDKNIEPRLTHEFRPGDVRHFTHDATAIKALGFEACYPLEAGLKCYVDWIKTQGQVQNYFSSVQGNLRCTGVVYGIEKVC